MAEMTRSKEVPVQLLRWTCNPELLGFDTTKECAKTDNIIGQNRAVKAITLGLEIESPGYNIYVSGMTGTGKTTTIKNLLSQLDLKKPIPDDICYVHNFKDPDMPRAIMFPAGSGRKLQKDMDDLVAHLRKEIPLILESDEFKKESEEVINTYRQKQKEIIREFNDRLLKENFQLVQFQMGPFTRQDIAP
ncbi:MAG TPA: Lon-like protease helical domain-containing protein, partial [Syntrophales bacterium]